MAQNINKNWEYTIKNQVEFICKCIDNSIDYALGKKEPLMRALEQSGPDAYFEREMEKFSDRAAALAAYKAFIVKATAEEYGIGGGAAAAASPSCITEESAAQNRTRKRSIRETAELIATATDMNEDVPWA